MVTALQKAVLHFEAKQVWTLELNLNANLHVDGHKHRQLLSAHNNQRDNITDEYMTRDQSHGSFSLSLSFTSHTITNYYYYYYCFIIIIKWYTKYIQYEK